ncbi:MAG: hypothetical protein M1812_005537 [Candelaria pacifica]|nr:MAG: hypothetical protein M1812_005537 [Candelaria pacifica]
MFSEVDIRWLSHTIPSVEKSSHSFPPLIPLESGSGFLKPQKLRSQLRNIVFTDVSRDRLDVSRLAHGFGIKPGFVSDLLPENPEQSGWILAQTGQIVTRSHYDALLDTLRTQSQKAPIDIFKFINEHGISDCIFIRLVREYNDINRKQNTAATLNAILEELDGSGVPLIYSRAYRHALEADVLKACQEAKRPYVLDPRLLQGCPPVDFIYEIVEDLAKAESGGPKPSIRLQGATVVYTPSHYLAQQRKDLIEKLWNGVVDWLAVRDFDESQRTTSETRQYVHDTLGDKVIMLDDYVISVEYLKRRVAAIIVDLDRYGYATVCPGSQSYPSTPHLSLAKEDSETLSTIIMRMIMEDWDSSRNPGKLDMVGDFIVRSEFAENFTNDIIERARLQAQTAWETLEYPVLDWQALLSGKEDESPGIIPFLRQSSFNSDLKKSARDGFTAETQKLKQKADLQFQTLWHHRLMAKLQLYQAGLESLTDEKLRGELRGTLEAHVLQNLLPDVIRKAEKGGIIRDKTMRRNVDSLNAFLASAQTGEDHLKSSFADLIAALETFKKKQKIERITEGELREKKYSQVNEMVRSMGENNDAPRLFLTLVVVLLATKGPGVVYATGKFAPRLVKQLRGNMDAEQLKALETVKDAVKAGKLTSDQKAFMINLAESAVKQF